VRPQHPACQDAEREDGDDADGELHLATPVPGARPPMREGPRCDHVVPGSLVIDAERRQHLRRCAAVLLQEGQHDVLAADAVVDEKARLVGGAREGSSAPARERDERGPKLLFAAARDPLYADTGLLEGQPSGPQHLRAEPVVTAKDTEQQMLGANLPVPEAARLVPREIEGLSGCSSQPLHSCGGY